MPPSIYIGIDPGKTGAAAIIAPENYYPMNGASVHDADTTKRPSVFLWLHGRMRVNEVQVLVELPDGRPGQGQRNFIFGAGAWYGYFCALCGREPIKLNASVWTSAMGVGTNKEDSLELARELFPALAPLLTRKKDHNRAQALLIAEYGRRNQL